NIYWGDIHNHNEIGYGQGSLVRSFDLAENALDFYGVTPHGWWPDLPKDDDTVRRQHQQGFDKVKANWNRIQQLVRERYQEDQFVTLLGWEWHSLEWGDYCLYFPDDEQELYYADNLADLKVHAASRNAIMIPHHPAYKQGWRGLNWNCLDESLAPVVEIFSEHGNSLEANSHLGMYNHSMGGMERSQSGLEQLKKGLKFGFVASSDDHYGYPGGYGYGLTGVYADNLNRKNILNALKKRHTYAVTGDRIRLYFNVNEAIPGDLIAASDEVNLEFSIRTRDRIKTVEIFKNSVPFKIYTELDFSAKTGLSNSLSNDSNNEHLVRIEWGWDFLSSDRITKWDIRLSAKNSVIKDLVPAFCGGAGSVTEMNLLKRVDDQHVVLNSFTSRKNAFPVNSITFLWQGKFDAGIELDIMGIQDRLPFKRKLKIVKRDLVDKDAYLSLFERFSSPKLKVHSLLQPADYEFCHSTIDPSVQPGDYYFLKVSQENGQMAWSSPVWIEGKKDKRSK
ncbi:DUF3604 domain-containing protein, partial [bacterium]|nr:DUF3604 domain-containing protein [bacterium]